MQWATLGIGWLISFVSVFLKGFQHQNVIGGHFKWAAALSYLMALADVAIIKFSVDKGWIMALPLGTGAAMGIVTSMYLHRRFLHNKKDNDHESSASN